VGELVIFEIWGSMMSYVIGEGENKGWYETAMMTEFCYRRQGEGEKERERIRGGMRQV